MNNRIASLGFVLLTSVMLVACGRAGDALTPYESAVKQAKENGTAAPKKPVKERPFILDGLLD